MGLGRGPPRTAQAGGADARGGVQRDAAAGVRRDVGAGRGQVRDVWGEARQAVDAGGGVGVVVLVVGSRPQGADAAAAAAAARRRAEAARNAAKARGANAAAVEYAGRVCVYGTAARVCAREFGVDQLNHLVRSPASAADSVSTATSSDALCGAFVPNCRGRRLVTGHADGKLYVWFDRTCERVVDAHGGFPVRR